MSPGSIASTARSATSPMQSSAIATGRLMMRATSAATGFNDCLGSRPFGRPKCESRMTLPPLSAISVMPGAARLMRVESVTTPFSTGTFRSTRRRTRFPFTSTWSSVRKAVMAALHSTLEKLAHRHGRIRHAVREAPLIVIPRHHTHECAVHNLGLIHVERARMRVMVEVDRYIGVIGIGKNAFELLLRGALHSIVDLFLRRLPFCDDLEVNHRNIRGRHANSDAVELAVEFRQYETNRLCGAR